MSDTLNNALDAAKNATSPPMSVEQVEARIAELAQMSPVAYDRLRVDEAKRMGFTRISVLDKAVEGLRPAPPENDELFPEITPWPEPVDGGTLLNELVKTIQRFVICSMEATRAAALWIVLTWFTDVISIAPLAVITAPEKQCGKSTLLRLFRRLCFRPLMAANISSAAIYRTIERDRPTLLIDECDSWLRDNEEARGIINCGHSREDAYVIRIEGEGCAREPRRFFTFGPKALSGIGRLADTIEDRAFILPLRRKNKTEIVELLRHAKPELFTELVSKLAKFAIDNRETIQMARPQLPASLNDRQQDNWEVPFAIADIAGGDWPKLARATAEKISGVDNNSDSIGCELLSDIQEVFEAKSINSVSLKELLKLLCEDDEWPWSTYNRGNPMTTRQLSKKLRSYGVETKTRRFGIISEKSYDAMQFQDVFERYIQKKDETDNETTAEAYTNQIPLEIPVTGNISTQPHLYQQINELPLSNVTVTESDSVTELTPIVTECADVTVTEKPLVTKLFNDDAGLREMLPSYQKNGGYPERYTSDNPSTDYVTGEL